MDDGTVDQREVDFDELQKKVNRMRQKTYPRVPYMQRVIKDGNKQILAVVVLGSEQRPHFAGQSFIRVGSETKEATPQQLDFLIAQRNSKMYRISQAVGTQISVRFKHLYGNGTFTMSQSIVYLIECNEWWLIVKVNDETYISFPLADVELSFDNKRRTLELQVEKPNDY